MKLFHRVIDFILSHRVLFMRYISVGAIAAAFEFSLFIFFYNIIQWPLLISNSTAFGFAVFVAFVLQKHWTFGVEGGGNKQLWLYIFMQAISGMLNNVLMYVFVESIGVFPLVAKVLQIGIVFIWNFSFCRFVVFALPLARVDKE